MAHRPTPRHGWPRAHDGSDETPEPEKDSAVLRVPPSKVDSTVSLVGLADTIAVAKPASRKASGGLPPVPNMFERLPSAAEKEPADALAWKPSAPTPGVLKRGSLAPAKAVHETEATRDLSLTDLSFAKTLPDADAKTEVDSVDELSLPGTDATGDTRRESYASAAMNARPPLFSSVRPSAPSTVRPAPPSTRRPAPRAAWLLVATCGVVAIDWGLFSSAFTRNAFARLRPTSMDVLARQPSGPKEEPTSMVATGSSTGASRSQEPPLSETPSASATGQSAAPSPGPSANAENVATPVDEADDDEAKDDAEQTGAVAHARELVDQGRALHKGKKYKQAEERYREALEVHPGYPRALRGLVLAAIAQGKGRQAVQFAKQLQRARPGQVANLVLLGDAYESAGKRKEARASWQAAARKGSATARARLKR